MTEVAKIANEFVSKLAIETEKLAKEKVSGLIRQVGGMAAFKEAPSKPSQASPATKQLCPIPDCKKMAAPAFDMVCQLHKDTSPRRIAQYRKARKLSKKLGLPVKKLLADWETYRKRAN